VAADVLPVLKLLYPESTLVAWQGSREFVDHLKRIATVKQHDDTITNVHRSAQVRPYLTGESTR
jgi:hypothetical protein